LTNGESFSFTDGISWRWIGLPLNYFLVHGDHCASKLSSAKMKLVWADEKLLEIRIEQRVQQVERQPVIDAPRVVAIEPIGHIDWSTYIKFD